MIKDALELARKNQKRYLENKDYQVYNLWIQLEMLLEALARGEVYEKCEHGIEINHPEHCCSICIFKDKPKLKLYTESELQQRIKEEVDGLYTQEKVLKIVKAEVDRVVEPLVVSNIKSNEDVDVAIREVLKRAGKI